MDDAERVRLAATFDSAAQLYDRARPGFPDQAIDWVLPAGGSRVLDLGAGTGKLSRSLVARGLDVIAVDASPGMLAVLRRNLPGVHVLQAQAENTGLPGASVDAVVAGSAFHWFQRPATDIEIARVLRPGGRVGLLWNRRNPSFPLAAEIDALLGSRRRTTPEEHSEVVLDPQRFGPTERRDVRHAQRVTPEGFAELIGSRSYVLVLPDEEREALLAEIQAAAARFSGGQAFDVPYLTVTLRATRR